MYQLAKYSNSNLLTAYATCFSLSLLGNIFLPAIYIQASILGFITLTRGINSTVPLVMFVMFVTIISNSFLGMQLLHAAIASLEYNLMIILLSHLVIVLTKNNINKEKLFSYLLILVTMVVGVMVFAFNMIVGDPIKFWQEFFTQILDLLAKQNENYVTLITANLHIVSDLLIAYFILAWFFLSYLAMKWYDRSIQKEDKEFDSSKSYSQKCFYSMRIPNLLSSIYLGLALLFWFVKDQYIIQNLFTTISIIFFINGLSLIHLIVYKKMHGNKILLVGNYMLFAFLPEALLVVTFFGWLEAILKLKLKFIN